MKKAKLVMAIIAMVGIVGGAFAFKAKTAYTGSTYYVTTVEGNLPDITLNGVKFTAPTTTLTLYYWTKNTNDAATVSTYFTSSAAE
jgi:hypothetical protein